MVAARLSLPARPARPRVLPCPRAVYVADQPGDGPPRGSGIRSFDLLEAIPPRTGGLSGLRPLRGGSRRPVVRAKRRASTLRLRRGPRRIPLGGPRLVHRPDRRAGVAIEPAARVGA